ncbi:MAG: Na+-translocating ferredoxin:NAD+ oxidoreductase RnfC subunit [Candidatus Paceibacteria bacterium]|jgi:Na+-translocating ferredoxin:NAD+ oxidoreductase RnfC subunit
MLPAMPTTSPLIDRVRENGVVGAGGAGFPTYEKLKTSAEVLILNAAECEPLLHKDKELLIHHGTEVLDGMLQLAESVNATRSIVAIKEKYTGLIEQLLPEATRRGIEIHRLPDSYPAGDEFITIYETTGRIVPPGGLPKDVGCLVQNVETVLNIQRDLPVTHKFLCVVGDVPTPMTVRVPVGTSFRDVLTTCGVDPEKPRHVQVGGVMMGSVMQSMDEVVTRTTGALLCFGLDHVVTRKYTTTPRQRDVIGMSACDQCSFCTELCPRYLLGHPVEPHIAMRSLEFNALGEDTLLGSQFCCECNLCTLYACPEDLFPSYATMDLKRKLRDEGKTHPVTGRTDLPVHSMAEYRRVPVSSLIKKLGLAQFENVGPLTELDWNPSEVQIPLKQHIGAPAVACVQTGTQVQPGDLIGKAADGLGVPIHASIAGTVSQVGSSIHIRR